MTITVYEELEQGSQAWLGARAGLVTASTVGKLITTRTLRTADNDTSRGFIRTLAAERITGRPEETGQSFDMMRGTMAEPFAREAYADHTGVEVEEVGFMVRDFPGFKLGFSPDGLIGDRGILEIKSPRMKSHMQTLLTGQIPEMYLPQLHAGLLVSDREVADFVSYFPGLPLFIARMRRTEVWDRAIVDAVADAEDKIEQTITEYEKATSHLPDTEWVDVFEEEGVELTL